MYCKGVVCMAKTLLELKNVSKIYGMDHVQVKALDNVSLEIKQGEFVAVMGPSGSGKSTMLDIIGLLSRPTQGKVFADGKDVSRMKDDSMAVIRRERIGFVFQTFNLINRLTAEENIMLPMWFDGMPEDKREKRATELLTLVGLGERTKHRPSELSGGQRQRVAIARSLANDPEIILADEPTGNLDTKTGAQILDLLKDLNKKGKTIVLITHDPGLGEKATRKVHIRDGKIVDRL